MSHCVCGSKKSYQHCCEPYITGIKTPSTPEELMRSRYTAYAHHRIDYIEKTMTGAAAKNFNMESAEEWSVRCLWKSLTVLREELLSKNHGFVEFIAEYEYEGVSKTLHEVSEFRQINGVWFYVDGTTPIISRNPRKKQVKVGRNEPCPCGSGKKYKYCCSGSS